MALQARQVKAGLARSTVGNMCPGLLAMMQNIEITVKLFNESLGAKPDLTWAIIVTIPDLDCYVEFYPLRWKTEYIELVIKKNYPQRKSQAQMASLDSTKTFKELILVLHKHFQEAGEGTLSS